LPWASVRRSACCCPGRSGCRWPPAARPGRSAGATGQGTQPAAFAARATTRTRQSRRRTARAPRRPRRRRGGKPHPGSAPGLAARDLEDLIVDVARHHRTRVPDQDLRPVSRAAGHLEHVAAAQQRPQTPREPAQVPLALRLGVDALVLLGPSSAVAGQTVAAHLHDECPNRSSTSSTGVSPETPPTLRTPTLRTPTAVPEAAADRQGVRGVRFHSHSDTSGAGRARLHGGPRPARR